MKTKEKNVYFIVLKSNNPKLDAEYGKDLMIETTHLLHVGDIINFSLEENKILEKDYATSLFKIIERVFIVDSDDEHDGGIIHLYVSPIK